MCQALSTFRTTCRVKRCCAKLFVCVVYSPRMRCIFINHSISSRIHPYLTHIFTLMLFNTHKHFISLSLSLTYFSSLSHTHILCHILTYIFHVHRHIQGSCHCLDYHTSSIDRAHPQRNVGRYLWYTHRTISDHAQHHCV